MRTISSIALGVALALPAWAVASPNAGGGPPARGPASIAAPAGQERVRITVSLISYPGVPERSACRMLFRAVNETDAPVEMAALLHTYDTYQADQNSWLVPTGTMQPGQQVERLYSCKGASFLSLDQRSDRGWPRSCAVAGEVLTPCPVALKLDSNLQILVKD